jgi:hypothetical protein
MSVGFVVGRIGLPLLCIGVVSAWIAFHFSVKMNFEVERRTPSKSTGLRNLLEATQTIRIWRDHKRLFPESKLRSRAKAFYILAGVSTFLGFILFGKF